jgi:hypothetical protein
MRNGEDLGQFSLSSATHTSASLLSPTSSGIATLSGLGAVSTGSATTAGGGLRTIPSSSGILAAAAVNSGRKP